MTLVRLALLLCCMTAVSGCVLTKVATVPMRVGGAAASLLPGVGNTVHDAIDKAAAAVDEVPI